MTKPRVLVVEDDPDIRELVVMVLGVLGVEILEATSGGEALEAARTFVPDLVTLDIGLPDMDGVEACRRLREFSDAHVLMLTAHEETAGRAAGADSGADDYMAKPFHPRDLRAAVERALRARGVVGGGP